MLSENEWINQNLSQNAYSKILSESGQEHTQEPIKPWTKWTTWTLTYRGLMRGHLVNGQWAVGCRSFTAFLSRRRILLNNDRVSLPEMSIQDQWLPFLIRWYLQDVSAIFATLRAGFRQQETKDVSQTPTKPQKSHRKIWSWHNLKYNSSFCSWQLDNKFNGCAQRIYRGHRIFCK